MKYIPMTARIGSEDDLKRTDFIFEPKLDGIRALCYVNSDLTFISRNQLNITQKYPEFDFRKNIKARSCILDGEIVAYDKKGRPSFTLLQQGYEATYVVFDIIMKNGELLTDLPLIERKGILEATVTPGPLLEKSPYTSDGKRLWKEVKKLGLEGVMAKKKESAYISGKRSSAWLKIKIVNTLDCVIVGFSSTKRAVSSLALGLYDNKGNLYYIGNVGTGFSQKTVQILHQKLQKLKISIAPVVNKPQGTSIIWTNPKEIAEIKYHELTHQGILRHSVFLRLRADKKPQECTIDAQLSAQEKKRILG